MHYIFENPHTYQGTCKNALLNDKVRISKLGSQIFFACHVSDVPKVSCESKIGAGGVNHFSESTSLFIWSSRNEPLLIQG